MGKFVSYSEVRGDNDPNLKPHTSILSSRSAGSFRNSISEGNIDLLHNNNNNSNSNVLSGSGGMMNVLQSFRNIAPIRPSSALSGSGGVPSGMAASVL